MDTSDALHSYQPRERKLEILKDSHAGAFAIITAVVYFLLYLGVYSEITLKSLPVVCIGFVLSRALGGFSIAAFPMAKNTGLAAAFSDGAQKQCVKMVCAIYGILCVVSMLAYDPLIEAARFLELLWNILYYYKMSMKEFSWHYRRFGGFSYADGGAGYGILRCGRNYQQIFIEKRKGYEDEINHRRCISGKKNTQTAVFSQEDQMKMGKEADLKRFSVFLSLPFS